MEFFTATKDVDAILTMSNGDFFLGKGIGKRGKTNGEICFNTGITGYQETLTDPSYTGQIITFTFPHIGNVGINSEDYESKRIFCKGLVIREDITNPSNFRSEKHLSNWLIEQNITGISNIDTRSLTKNIRDKGARHICIKYIKEGETINIKELLYEIKDKPNLLGKELTKEVTTDKQYDWNEHSFNLNQKGYKKQANHKYNIVAIDYGIKRHILRYLVDVGCKVTVMRSDASYDEIMQHNPDGIFLSNGPGDPLATSEFAVPVIKKLLERKIPIFGICLGNQLLSIAANLSTIKMEIGHRGANHPVQDLKTKRVYITSQNHGFCVSKENIPENIEITHLSLFDNTVEGISFKDRPAFSVQYHPESSPGPNDARFLFSKFTQMIDNNKNY